MIEVEVPVYLLEEEPEFDRLLEGEWILVTLEVLIWSRNIILALLYLWLVF